MYSPIDTELSHAEMCMQHIDHTLNWDGYDISYLTHFQFRAIQNNIMDFTLQRNSANHFCTISYDGAESE